MSHPLNLDRCNLCGYRNDAHRMGCRNTCTCPCRRVKMNCPVHGISLEELGLKPALRSYTSAERKAAPLHTVMATYFPDAFMALARLSKKANDKHNPGQPVHWAREKSTDHLDCAARHMLTPDVIDPETGEQERVAALWRLAADVQLAEEKRLVAAGIKPLSGVVGPIQATQDGSTRTSR